MTGPAPPPLAIDPGLLRRFRDAGAKVTWTAAPGPPGAPSSARIARLHEEEARIEERPTPGGHLLKVESGPVGALIVLLEIDRRGGLPTLSSEEAGADGAFPSGAIEARWGPPGGRSTLAVRDLIEVARYALV